MAYSSALTAALSGASENQLANWRREPNALLVPEYSDSGKVRCQPAPGNHHSAKAGGPQRQAEARITLGVVAARAGDLERAVSYGRQALEGDRKSLPSLLLVSKELATLLRERYPKEPEATSYLDEVRTLSAS